MEDKNYINAISKGDSDESMKVEIYIRNKMYKGMIDTGSRVSLIRYDVALECELDVEETDIKGKLVAVNESEIKVKGYVDADLQLGKYGQRVKCKLIAVCNISEQIIIGLDVLVKEKIAIDVGNSVLVINEKIIPMCGYVKEEAVDSPDKILKEKVYNSTSQSFSQSNNIKSGVKNIVEKYKKKNPKLGSISSYLFKIDLISDKIVQSNPYVFHSATRNI